MHVQSFKIFHIYINRLLFIRYKFVPKFLLILRKYSQHSTSKTGISLIRDIGSYISTSFHYESVYLRKCFSSLEILVRMRSLFNTCPAKRENDLCLHRPHFLAKAGKEQIISPSWPVLFKLRKVNMFYEVSFQITTKDRNSYYQKQKWLLEE